MKKIQAGSAQVDITPTNSQFLYGYPHVERYSTGVHDRIWSSALYISGGDSNDDLMFIANDIIYISKEMREHIRHKISEKTGLKQESIMVSATHTHSGPKTVDSLLHASDPAVPKADQDYVDFMLNQIVASGIRAYKSREPAQIGLSTATAEGVGTNRRDPSGPADLEVPVLMAVNLQGDPIACMLVCSMHPTVLHEDSTLITGDFPGLARIYLQENILGTSCPVLHHTGPAGNQSPRHVTEGNTFEEAERLGTLLGKSVQTAIENMDFCSSIGLKTVNALLKDLPVRTFPSVDEAELKLKHAEDKFSHLKAVNAPRAEVRTAECDVFGAERTLALARASADGTLEKQRKKCLPAEIQIHSIGEWNFVGWPGEVFIEYSLKVKQSRSNTYMIAYCNGLLNGYIVTEEAAAEGGYEASTAQFAWQTGDILVEKTLELLNK